MLTGNNFVDSVISVLGAVYVVATTLATVLPKEWPATKLLARIAADLRGIHQSE